MAELLRGEIYWADPDPVIGHEQAGRRPISPKHLMRDIVVKDGAHAYRPIERLVSSMKNCR